MTNEMTTPIYNKVLFTPLFNPNKGDERPITYIDDADFIINPKMEFGCEYVGGKKVNPYFDVDYKIPFETPKNDIEKFEEKKREECITKIDSYFSEYDISIYESDKKCRIIKHEGNRYYKISQRFYVKGVVMKNYNIMKLLNNKGITYEKDHNAPFDLGVYNDTRVLLLPYTYKPSKPEDKSKTILKPVKKDGEDFNVFNYCATYINETDKDLDILFNDDLKILKPKKKVVNEDKTLTFKDVKKTEEDNEEEMTEKPASIEVKLLEYINILTVKRADDYNTWINMLFCIINICTKHNISKRKCIEYLHTFSKKSNKYDEDFLDDWIEKEYKKAKENGGYAWSYLKHTCIKEDDSEYYKKRCGSTYYMVKKEFEQEIFKCMNPIGFLRVVKDEFIMKDNPNPIQILKESEVISSKRELYFWELVKDKKGVETLNKIPFVNKWLCDENKPIYERIVFKPYHLDSELSKKYYNLYEGTRAELLPVYKDYEKIQPVLDHIKNVMVNGNEEHYKWLMQYLAQIIQNPSKKTEVCVVFKGKQGCGKNIFIDAFANGILGKKLTISTANPADTFFGTFNGCTINKILGVCNEVGAEVYNCMDRIKDLITAPTTSGEEKYSKKVIVENYMNLIMTTNNTNPLNISVDDRRLVWFECNNDRKGDIDYFNQLLEILEDDENISSLYHYFKEEVKITITNFQINRPITTGYLRIQQLNLPSYIKWCKDYVRDKQFRKYKGVMVLVCKKNMVYESYKLWCDTNKYIALKRDTFMHYIEDKDTGIKKCISDGCECLRFNEIEVGKWLDSQGVNKNDVNIEVIDKADFIDDDDE